jgi:hypothetical protein
MHRAGIGRRLDQGPERNSRCGATRGSSERVIERADLAQILVSHEEQRSDAPQYVCAGGRGEGRMHASRLRICANGNGNLPQNTRSWRQSDLPHFNCRLRCFRAREGCVADAATDTRSRFNDLLAAGFGDRRGRTGERLESWDSSSTSSPAPIAFQPDYAAPVRNLR